MSGPGRPVFLVGFMGAGKTTLAGELGAALGWPAIDTDAWVERAAGCSIERIFRDRGEAGFRALEAQALAALDDGRPCVVATGGGMFCSAAGRRGMKCRGLTVWLDVPLEVCAARVGSGRGRPRWPSDPLALRALYERRRAVYALAEVRLAGPPEGPAGRNSVDFLRAIVIDNRRRQ